MIRKVSYESQERREKQVLAALNSYCFAETSVPSPQFRAQKYKKNPENT
jgi:hypothetical protein